MTANGIVQLVLYIAVILLLVKPVGWYMARVFQGESVGLNRVLHPVEKVIYWLSGTREDREMNWKTYALAMLVFNLLGFMVVFILQRIQASLPLNPAAMANVSPDSSFNTAISFMTNTNWQGYGGEATMSYLTQMVALTVQNFVSAATGMAVMVALFRGLARRSTTDIGNFWVDMTRSTLYILLPLSIIAAVVLVSQGVPQTFDNYATANVIDKTALTDANGAAVTTQTIALGPVASQEAIKQLGTNGGGFFNTNASHPFENPTPLSNFIEMMYILLLPAGVCYTFGKMIGDTRQGWALLTVMTIIFVALMFGTYAAEQNGNPRLPALGVDQTASAVQSGGNMEGKETRFGIADSAIWATATTAASNGSVNSMHDSYTPLGGLIPMWLIQLGEVIYGGVGSGLYGMLHFVFIAVFIAGLMVGRTPEYLGKKIEAYEMKMASISILIPSLCVLIGAGIAVVSADGLATIYNTKPAVHGFSEVLYAFSSAANNNGSAFAGLGANTVFYNTALGIAMFFGRFMVGLPALAIAGSLARKKVVPPGDGTLPTHTTLFIVLLIAIIIVVGALTFFPALALGPIVEHLKLIGS